MTIKYKVHKNTTNDKLEMMATIELNLGAISEQKKDSNTIFVPINIEGSKRIMKEALWRNVREEDEEKFEKSLAEYCKLWLNGIIGVQEYPLLKDGKQIKGLSEPFEMSDEGDND